VDSALNCAAAVKKLLAKEDLAADSERLGKLDVALTDRSDGFLRVAEKASRFRSVTCNCAPYSTPSKRGYSEIDFTFALREILSRGIMPHAKALRTQRGFAATKCGFRIANENICRLRRDQRRMYARCGKFQG